MKLSDCIGIFDGSKSLTQDEANLISPQAHIQAMSALDRFVGSLPEGTGVYVVVSTPQGPDECLVASRLDITPTNTAESITRTFIASWLERGKIGTLLGCLHIAICKYPLALRLRICFKLLTGKL